MPPSSIPPSPGPASPPVVPLPPVVEPLPLVAPAEVDAPPEVPVEAPLELPPVPVFPLPDEALIAAPVEPLVEPLEPTEPPPVVPLVSLPEVVDPAEVEVLASPEELAGELQQATSPKSATSNPKTGAFLIVGDGQDRPLWHRGNSRYDRVTDFVSGRNFYIEARASSLEVCLSGSRELAVMLVSSRQRGVAISLALLVGLIGPGCLSISGEELEGSTSAGQGSGGSTTGGQSTGGSKSGGQTSGGQSSGGSTTGGQTSGGTSCPYGGEPPCQFVVAPSALNFANPLPVGETSPVLTFEIQNVGVDLCLISWPIELTDGFNVVYTSIQPNPTGHSVAIPPPGWGENSTLTIELDLTCTVAGPVSTEFLCGTLTGTCG